MLIFIPGSIARSTGWKAVLGALIFAGMFAVIALQAWPRYRSFERNTITVPAGKTMALSFTPDQQSKFKAEWKASGVSAGLPYTVDLFDENNFKLLGLAENTKKPRTVIHTSAKGASEVSDVFVGAGTYHLLLTNDSPAPLTVDYQLWLYR